MQEKFFARTWAEIDLSAICKNYHTVRASVAPESSVCAVVKADAYGHGVGKVAPTLSSEGVDCFAVSCLSEAEELRALGIELPILILGYTPCEFAATLTKHNFIQTVYSLDYAEDLSACAVENGVSVKCHIKLDTGMSRLGFDVSE